MSHSKFSVWIKAARLRAFPLALSCVALGGFLAAERNEIDWTVLSLAVITTILLQLLSNLANDLGDSVHGADHIHRRGPTRTVQSGLISRRSMKTAVILISILSFASGILLILVSVESWRDGMVFLGLGIVAILAAIGYTMGKRPYGYYGLGDLSVFIFFGWVGVVGTYYLQTHSFDPILLLPASACSFFAVAVLNVNNIRDIESDRQAGKFTFAARLGHDGARKYHLILLCAGILSAALYTWISGGQWLFLLALPLVAFNGWNTYKRTEVGALDPLVRQMAMTSLIFVSLFGIGIVI
ncbi:MAG: 1,4-dihydroxy-2-naphthoate polyprenyltransferase [Saprospiraceae bacterium]|nr:1,4-dihydroxy-2-naphthoate polyprenyltransferase [Saprospiraceae bacterium]